MFVLNGSICFPTPVLTARFQGSGFTFSTPKSPPASLEYKKISPWGDDCPRWIHQLPYASVNCQVPRVRFYLLNSEESPRFRTMVVSIGKIANHVNNHYSALASPFALERLLHIFSTGPKVSLWVKANAYVSHAWRFYERLVHDRSD